MVYVAKHSGHHRLQSYTTSLWSHRLTPNSIYTWFEAQNNILSVCSRHQEHSVQNEATESCWSWQHAWLGAQGLCWVVCRCPYRYLQLFPVAQAVVPCASRHSSLCWRNHLYPIRRPTRPLHSHLSSWSALSTSSWNTSSHYIGPISYTNRG